MDDDAAYYISGYELLRNDRKNRPGGGVCIYYRETLPLTLLSSLSTNGTEAIWSTLQFPRSLPILVGVCYCPRPHHPQVFDCIETMLTTGPQCEIILLGDFNCDLLRPGSTPSHATLEEVTTHLQQLITTPTRITASTRSLLDHIYVSHPTRIIQTSVIPATFTDHDLTLCVRKIKTPLSPGADFFHVRSYSHFNASACIRDLTEASPLVFNETSANDACAAFQSMVINVLDKHAPTQCKRKRVTFPAWLTPHIRHLLFLRDYHKKRVRSSTGAYHESQYRNIRNQVTLAIRQSKARALSTQLQHATNNPRESWKVVLSHIKPTIRPSISCLRNLESLLTEPAAIAEHINMTFTSATSPCLQPDLQSIAQLGPIAKPPFDLCEVTENQVETVLKHLNPRKATGPDGIPTKFLRCAATILAKPLQYVINNSIAQSSFPSSWKMARVIPLFKKGDPLESGNYRPVSILPAASKVMERLVHDQLSLLLEDGNILYSLQSGFRPRHSTITACAILLERIEFHLAHGLYVGVTFIDITKAFDSVDHQILTHKLTPIFSQGSIEWLDSYLTDRSQQVCIQSTSSSYRPVSVGVPQGSILGPSLFSLYSTNQHIQDPNVEVFKYADDEADLRASEDLQELITLMDRDSELIAQKLHRDNMALNRKKSVFMIFSPTSPQRMAAQQISTLPSTGLQRVDHFTYLGLCIEDTLSWQTHITTCHKKIRKKLWVITYFRRSASTRLLDLLYKTLIQPLFDYGDIFFTTGRKRDLAKLQRLQNTFARIIAALGRYSSSSLAMRQLGWLDIEIRARIHTILHVHRTIQGRTPRYLQALYTPAAQVHDHNTRGSISNIFLPTPQTTKQKLGLTHRSITEWNSLPSSLKTIVPEKQFKSELLKFFQSQSQTP